MEIRRALAWADVLRDAEVCLRGLVRSPVLTLTIVLTVGLGIGATTAIFAAVDAALLRPLPYADPGRLYRIYTDSPPNVFRFSVADYLAITNEATHFDGIAGYTERAMTFSDGRTAERLNGRVVTSTYFDVLGIRLQMGQGFSAGDGTVGSPPAVVVSHAFWRDRLGRRPDVIGRAVQLDGIDHVVRGVLAPAVGPLEARQDFFVAAQWTTPPRKGPFFIVTLGRLKDSVTPAAAAEELRAINQRMFPIWQSSYQDGRATWNLMPLASHVVGPDAAAMSITALASVGLLWLIACANASGLLIARVVSRRRELAVRAALGASRARVLRLLLAEGALLAALSLSVGVAIAWGGTRLIGTVGAAFLPRTQEIALAGRAGWMLMGLALMSLALFALVPALHGSGGPVASPLRLAGRSTAGSAQTSRLRRLLVGGQFAIATPLLVMAALFLSSLSQLRQVELGIDGRNVLSASVQLAGPAYDAPERRSVFWDDLRRGIEQVPGVSAVTYANGLPPAGVDDFNNFDLEQFPAGAGQSQPVTPWIAVAPDYFGVLGITLVEGRLLDERDLQEGQPDVVVVDRAWARRLFPNESAVGKRLKSGGCSTCDWTTVVGVVSNVKYAGLDAPDEGTVYSPLTPGRARYLLVRTSTNPNAVTPAIRDALRRIDPAVPLSAVATMDDLVNTALRTPGFLARLIGGLAAVALVLSIVAIYGMMAFHVQQHARDICIRLALGATPSGILTLVVGRGLKTVALGVAFGLTLAFLLARSAATLLFGVSPADATTFAAVSALLIAMALIASLIPTVRAVRVNPSTVLREV